MKSKPYRGVLVNQIDLPAYHSILEASPFSSGNPVRLAHLATLNEWRNVAAHQRTLTAKAGPLNLSLVGAWRISCDGLAVSLDDIVYNHLGRILRRKPW